MAGHFKKRLWQFHSWLGLIAGLGLIVIGLSGSLLVFRDELQSVISPEMVNVAPTPKGRLSADALLATAQAGLPGAEVTGWLFRKEPHLADVVYLIPHGKTEALLATIDPYTGKILTNPLQPNSTFTGWLLELHYELLAGHGGMLVAGLLAVSLCLLGVSGVWLYRGFWKNLFTLRWNRSARIFFSDAHKMIGISSVAFNLVLGFTGAFWNLSHVLSEWNGTHPVQKPILKKLYANDISPSQMLVVASEKLPGFRAGFLSFPFAEGENLVFWGKVEPAGFWRGEYGSTVMFDAQTGAFKSLSDIRQAGLWAQIYDAFAPFHYGSFGGLTIKILWCLGGLTPGALAILGFLMWRARRRQGDTSKDSTSAGPKNEPAILQPERQHSLVGSND